MARDLGAVQLRLGMGRVPGNLFFDQRVKLAEGAGGIGRFAQDVAATETGEIVSGVMKAELMHSAMRAKHRQVSTVEVGIHLHNSAAVIGIFIRIHLEKHSWILKLRNIAGRGPNIDYLYIVMCTIST
jgi:hypothetical protein